MDLLCLSPSCCQVSLSVLILGLLLTNQGTSASQRYRLERLSQSWELSVLASLTSGGGCIGMKHLSVHSASLVWVPSRRRSSNVALLILPSSPEVIKIGKMLLLLPQPREFSLPQASCHCDDYHSSYTQWCWWVSFLNVSSRETGKPGVLHEAY